MRLIPANLKNTVYSAFAIGICLAIGKFIAAEFHGLPGSLYGLILFTMSLHFSVFSAAKVQQSISWIISNMGVCFVPSGVGIINHFELIKQHGLTIVTIIFITTFLLLTLVGLWFERFNKIKLSDKKASEEAAINLR